MKKIFLSETTRPIKSLDIWYEALPSKPLPRLFKLYPLGQIWPHPEVHTLYIGLYKKKHEKLP